MKPGSHTSKDEAMPPLTSAPSRLDVDDLSSGKCKGSGNAWSASVVRSTESWARSRAVSAEPWQDRRRSGWWRPMEKEEQYGVSWEDRTDKASNAVPNRNIIS
eukprot:1048742-Amphidinium_carterae.1